MEQTVWDFDEAVSVFESPIEKVFAANLLTSFWQLGRVLSHQERDVAVGVLHGVGITYEISPDLPHELSRRDQLFLSLGGEALCLSQAELCLSDRTIRADFAFIDWTTTTQIIVELDGHDWHERTPEQAQADKSRDRELQRLGWSPLRFTGREVLRAPSQCHSEVTELLFAKRRLRRAEAEIMEPTP